MIKIETIIALLEAKFPGVRKDVIKNLAGVIALQVDDEAGAKSIVDKLTADKVSAFGTDFRSNIDREIHKPWELTSRAVGKVLQICEKSRIFAASKMKWF